MNIIDVNNVSFTYEGAETPALQNVSLQVHTGEFLCILGANGSGKSTLAKLMNALYQPTGGTVIVAGLQANGATEETLLAIRKAVGMVFQNPDNQLVATIVEDDIAFGPENLGLPREELIKRVDAALAAVNMQEFRASMPHKLSGGQKQRVAIAGVLAMEPAVLVLDESTAMLDPSGRREVLETALRQRREKGITLVLVTHFMEEAVQADRVVILHKGRVAAQGTPREIFANPEKLAAFSLRPPEMTSLAHALRAQGVTIPPDILTAEELAEALWPLL